MLSILLMVAQFIFIPICAAFMGHYEYGIFMLYKSASHQGLIAIFALGFNIIIRRNVANCYPQKINIPDLMNLILLVLITVPFLMAISNLLPNTLEIPFYLISIFIVNELFLVYIISVAEGLRKTTHIRFLDILVTLVLVIYIITYVDDLKSLIYLLFFANICKSIYLVCLSTRINGAGCGLTFSQFNLRSGHLTVANMISNINNNFERYIFSIFIGIESIIYLDIIQKFCRLFKNQIGVFTVIIQPFYQYIRYLMSGGEMMKVVSKAFAPVYLCIILLTYASIDVIIIYWMGYEYLFLSTYIVYTMPALLLYLLNSLYGMVLVVEERYHVTAMVQFCITTIRILLTVVLISKFSYWIIVLNVYVLFLIGAFIGTEYKSQKLNLFYYKYPVAAILLVWVLEILELRGTLMEYPQVNLAVILVTTALLVKSISNFTQLLDMKLRSTRKENDVTA